MEFKELIKRRRSVRSLQAGRTIDKETIEEILRDTQMAPSYRNSQTGRYYVVCDPEKMAKISNDLLPERNRLGSRNTCAYIVTTFVKGIAGFTNGAADNELGDEWGAYDLGLQNAYFVLSASDHGLDTLIMGIRDAQGLRALLDIPEEEEVAAVLSIGYRDGEPALRPRKDLGEIVFFS